MMRKVFCLGFQKSGTSSLGLALSRLGYRVAGYWQFRDLGERAEVSMDDLLERARSLVGQFDAFKDTPWPVLYRDLDKLYPNSKFIHIVRDPQRWIASAVGDFKAWPNPIHKAIYGSAFPDGNEAAWIERQLVALNALQQRVERLETFAETFYGDLNRRMEGFFSDDAARAAASRAV